MKVRNGFVSNSSSQSFVVTTNTTLKTEELPRFYVCTICGEVIHSSETLYMAAECPSSYSHLMTYCKSFIGSNTHHFIDTLCSSCPDRFKCYTS